MLAFHPVLKFKTGILAQPRSPSSVQSPSCMSGFSLKSRAQRTPRTSHQFLWKKQGVTTVTTFGKEDAAMAHGRLWLLYHLRACPGNVVSVLVGVMSFSKINSEGFKSPVTGTRVLEILCVKNRPERPLRSLIAKAHSQKPNCRRQPKAEKLHKGRSASIASSALESVRFAAVSNKIATLA